jgi:hypothetical protein
MVINEKNVGVFRRDIHRDQLLRSGVAFKKRILPNEPNKSFVLNGCIQRGENSAELMNVEVFFAAASRCQTEVRDGASNLEIPPSVAAALAVLRLARA